MLLLLMLLLLLLLLPRSRSFALKSVIYSNVSLMPNASAQQLKPKLPPTKPRELKPLPNKLQQRTSWRKLWRKRTASRCGTCAAQSMPALTSVGAGGGGGV
jgi:hypothetical protein